MEGNTYFSELLELQLEPQEDQWQVISLFPNPCTESTRLVLQSQIAAQGILSLYDALGKLVRQETLPLSSGKTELDLDLSQQAAGIYRLHIAIDGQRKVVNVARQ